MRRAALVILTAWALVGAAPADKKLPPVREATGLEWLQMSLGQRSDQVLAAMVRITQSGVRLSDSPDEYYNAVHDAVRRDISLYEVPVTQIIARHAYQREPAAREALDALERRRVPG